MNKVSFYYPEFFTCAILNWYHLLEDDRFKQIIIDSLEWLSNNNRCDVFGFVIMPNHLHLIWQAGKGFHASQLQKHFLSYTAHEFKAQLLKEDDSALEKYRMNYGDRAHQFWKNYSMSKECWTEKFFLQKLEYIHNNPCQVHWNLAARPEDYRWSSAQFYETGETNFPWLKHFMG